MIISVVTHKDRRHIEDVISSIIRSLEKIGSVLGEYRIEEKMKVRINMVEVCIDHFTLFLTMGIKTSVLRGKITFSILVGSLGSSGHFRSVEI